MNAGKQIDPADEYEAAAEYVARKFGKPIDAQVIRALLNVPPHVLDSIEINPHHWRDCVNRHAMAIAS